MVDDIGNSEESSDWFSFSSIPTIPREKSFVRTTNGPHETVTQCHIWRKNEFSVI